jgi:hypothetical protein
MRVSIDVARRVKWPVPYRSAPARKRPARRRFVAGGAYNDVVPALAAVANTPTGSTSNLSTECSSIRVRFFHLEFAPQSQWEISSVTWRSEASRNTREIRESKAGFRTICPLCRQRPQRRCVTERRTLDIKRETMANESRQETQTIRRPSPAVYLFSGKQDGETRRTQARLGPGAPRTTSSISTKSSSVAPRMHVIIDSESVSRRHAVFERGEAVTVVGIRQQQRARQCRVVPSAS